MLISLTESGTSPNDGGKTRPQITQYKDKSRTFFPIFIDVKKQTHQGQPM